MTKYDRLLYILTLLRSRRNLNARKLAEECGVTERSIYRDIVALSEASVPIYYDNGYKLASENFLPPLNFDFDEYHCLRLALESSPLSKTAKYRTPMKRIKAKVEAGLSESVRKKQRFTPETTRIDIATTTEEERGERYYGMIEEAITSWRCLYLEYDSINTGFTCRVVEPYFIIFKGRAFYFVGFCRLRQDVRTFRIDRVAGLKLLDERFTRQDDITPESYFEGSWEVYSGEPVEVVVKLRGSAARVVLSGRHHPAESVERISDEEVLYKVKIRGLDEIQRWLLGFGAEAEVLAPAELRERMGEVVKQLAEMYGIGRKRVK
ncbi:MAG TPA: YafY family protein [Candidatus Deferrimicrobium sp.]|nr:YafY family protein [Candidatus Deferrimicrobium sp.]